MKPRPTPEQVRACRAARVAQARTATLLKHRRSDGRHAWGLKVDRLLRPEHRTEYEVLLRDPMTTRRVAEQWLAERGYVIGQSAVLRHMKQFRQRIDAVRDAAEMSLACAELARETGQVVLSDGALARFETLLAQALFKVESGGQLKREQWDMLGKALTSAVSNRTRLEELRRGFEESKRAAATAAEDAAKQGADASTVVDRVKEILGV